MFCILSLLFSSWIIPYIGQWQRLQFPIAICFWSKFNSNQSQTNTRFATIIINGYMRLFAVVAITHQLFNACQKLSIWFWTI